MTLSIYAQVMFRGEGERQRLQSDCSADPKRTPHDAGLAYERSADRRRR